jgi:Kef-type K+ transport system membrane component KefB
MAEAGPALPLRARLAVSARGVFMLAVVGGWVYLAQRFEWLTNEARAVLMLGVLFIAGTAAGQLASVVKLPRLTGYLIAGLIVGPHVLNIIDKHDVHTLSAVNALALALIALDAGAELTVDILRRGVKSLLWQCLTQSTIIVIGAAVIFIALVMTGLLELGGTYSLTTVIAISGVWGVLATSKSPAVMLAVLQETNAKGKVAELALGVVILFDILVLVLFAVAVMFAEAMLVPGREVSLDAMSALGLELFASVAAGTTFGLVVAAFFWMTDKDRLLFLVALGYGVSAFCQYFHYDTLLVFAVAGFVVVNLTKQGEAMIHSVRRLSTPVMVVFFATAGAHLDLALLATAWPFALLFAGTRAGLTWSATRVGSKLANDPPVVKRWLFTSFISQAGVTIGLSALVAERLPSVGETIATLSIAVVGINELIGPVVAKLGLVRAEAEEGVAHAKSEHHVDAPTQEHP